MRALGYSQSLGKLAAWPGWAGEVMLCVDCRKRERDRGWETCAACACIRHEAYKEAARFERAEGKIWLQGNGPILLSDDGDDWRPNVHAKAVLPQPINIFPSDSATWKRINPAPRPAAVSCFPAIEYYDDGIWPIEWLCAYVELKDSISEVLSTLSPMEEEVIRMRFGVGEYDEHTQEEICKFFGKSKSRISQIEKIALRKLRHPKRFVFFQEFLNA